MLLTKLKIATAVLLAVVVVAAGARAVLLPARTAQRPQPMKAERHARQHEGKATPKAKPVIVREDAQVRSLAWSSNGKVLATVGIVYEQVEFTDGDGNPTDSG